MTTLYAESSAVLDWLLSGLHESEVEQALAGADEVVSSTLTGAEIERTLTRLCATGVIASGERERAWNRFALAAGCWTLYAVTAELLARSGAPFPVEPLRTLDAIHLATAVFHVREVGPLTVLTLDARVRDNARAMAMETAP